MKVKLSHMVAAAAVVGFLGFGGVSLAYAADGTTTTTTPSSQGSGPTTAPAPGAPAPGERGDHMGGPGDANCPNMGGSTSGGQTGSSSSSSTSGASL